MKINVLMVPDFLKKNFYQKLLKDALFRINIKLELPKYKTLFFPIFRNLIYYKNKIIHIHWIHEYAGFHEKNIFYIFLKSFIFIFDIFLSKLFLRSKIIWTMHNLYSHDSKHLFIEKIIRKLFLRFVNECIVHCNYAKILLIHEFHYNPQKISIIPHGNYLDCYENNISKKEARKFLNLNDDDFIFLNFGQIKYYKGIDLLIEVFKNYKNFLGVKLLIVGNTEINLLKELKNKCKNLNNIIFNSKFIKDEDIQIYFNAADIIILPYRKILTSGAVYLAMSFAKPIIAPKLGCIPESLDENGNFLYYPPNIEMLDSTIKNSLNVKEKLNEMGKYNLKKVMNFNWDMIARKTKEVYIKYFFKN